MIRIALAFRDIGAIDEICEYPASFVEAFANAMTTPEQRLEMQQQRHEQTLASEARRAWDQCQT